MMQACLQIMAPGDRSTSSAEHEMKARDESDERRPLNIECGARDESAIRQGGRRIRHDTNGRMGHFGKNGKPQKKTGELKLHSVNSRNSKEL